MNNTQKLIKSLTKDIKPVTPTKPVIFNVSLWLLAVVFITTLSFFTLGYKQQILNNIHTTKFITENILILIAGICLSIAAIISSVPAYKKYQTVILTIISTTIWLAILMENSFNITSQSFIAEAQKYIGTLCTADVIMLSIIPAIILFMMIKKNASTNLAYTGFLALFATVSLGALSSRFLCPITDPSHLIIWHFAPVFIIGLLGIFLGRLLLKW